MLLDPLAQSVLPVLQVLALQALQVCQVLLAKLGLQEQVVLALQVLADPLDRLEQPVRKVLLGPLV